MTRWIVRMMVVGAVFGAYALGRGLHASAEVPASQAQKSNKGQFVCGVIEGGVDRVPGWMRDYCDTTRSFTVTNVPAYPRDVLLTCCVGR